MRRLHIVPGLSAQWSGIAVAAKMIAREQGAAIIDADGRYEGELSEADEVWVHSVWTFKVWRACWKAMRRRKRLVRMLHGNVDPVRLRYHGWKKWLVGPIERYFLRRADRIVATCEAEKGWIEAYLGKRCPPIEVTDIKRFFKLQVTGNRERGTVGKQVRPIFPEGNANPGSSPIPHLSVIASATPDPPSLHLLYLGRRHPLKGLEYLEEAVKSLEFSVQSSGGRVPGSVFRVGGRVCVFRMESNVFGEEKEKVWAWCDVLVLPTLSENFGLVVAEALERGKRVITTDGAPAWEGECKMESVKCKIGDGEIRSGFGGRLIYLVGYRDGSPEVRVRLLKEAIGRIV